MNITLLHEPLRRAVTLAERVSGKKLAVESLNGIRLNTQGGSVFVTATNLDLGISVEVPATIQEEGSVVIPGNILSGILSEKGTKGDISLSLEEGNLRVKIGANSSLIKALPGDDFPSLPHVEGGSKFSIEISSFIQGLKNVSYSSSQSTIKPELSSVYITGSDNGLVFVATDSFRLGEKIIPTKVSIEGLLIPHQNIPDIIRVLDDGGEQVTVEFTDNQIAFRCDHIYLTSRLTDGTFPDYKQIIPKDYVCEVTMLREEVFSALKKTTLFTDSFNQLEILVDSKKNSVSFSSENADIGKTVEEVQATIDGEGITARFNHRYVIDCFQSLHSDSVSFHFSGPSKPMIIRGVSDQSFLYLVMPMNR